MTDPILVNLANNLSLLVIILLAALAALVIFVGIVAVIVNVSKPIISSIRERKNPPEH